MSEISGISDEHPWTGLLPSVKTSSFQSGLPESRLWLVESLQYEVA